MNIKHTMAVLLVSSFAANVALADSCKTKDVKPQDVQQGVKASSYLEGFLNKTGAKVVLIGREGQDLSKYNMKFSHIGFAVKDAKNQQWSVYHELNSCPKDKSGLFKEGLGMFFLDDPASYQAAYVVPNKQIQDKLYSVLTAPNLPMHEENYSLVAYPFSVKRQNSNGWILETFSVAAADYPLYSRTDAQQWLVKQDYQPSSMKVSGAKQLFASLFISNVTLKDHPQEDTSKGVIKMNSGDSVLRFASRFRDADYQCPVTQLEKGICTITP